MRSADCETHSWRVAAFQVLPPIYPSGQKWSAEDNARYTPITQDIVDGVTHELTPKDIEQSLSWITQSMCIVTSNVYRAIINATAARALANFKMYMSYDGNVKCVKNSHGRPKPFCVTKTRDRNSLHTLLRELLDKC